MMAVSQASAHPRLKKRSDFLRAGAGRKSHGALLTLQVAPNAELPDGAVARVGFTVTKKVGNAVERNRIKRRLRETVRLQSDLGLRAMHDYVVVARRGLLTARPAAITSSLRAAVEKIHGVRQNGRAAPGQDRRRKPNVS